MHRRVLEGPRGLRLRCLVPASGHERARGLIGADRLDRDEALLIPNATSVHTFGMRFPLLVVRLDRSLRVVETRQVQRRRIVLPARRARHVLECSIEVDLRPGDELRSAHGGADEGEPEGGEHGEDADEDRQEAPGPGRKRDRLAPAPLWLHDPQELQQRSHPWSYRPVGEAS